MDVSVRGKNIEATPALKEYATRKVGKIERYFDVPVTGQVTMSVQKDRHIVEVTVSLNGFIVRGEEATGDMYASIDLVVDKIEKQILKYKTRLGRKLRMPERTGMAADIDEDEPRIVRVKRFAMKPMAVDEAIMQMNLIGHDFYVFVDSDTERVNVVYRRHDGDYGLIEPDF